MIIIDTSIWADHIRATMPELSLLLEREQVLQHPFVTGELALGNPQDRKAMVATLETLPQANVAEPGRLLAFADRHGLGGTGIGYVDAHLLLAVSLHRAKLWSRDGRLVGQAERLGLNYMP